LITSAYLINFNFSEFVSKLNSTYRMIGRKKSFTKVGQLKKLTREKLALLSHQIGISILRFSMDI